MNTERSKVDVILGIQWGDEGKGKFVDVLSPQYDIIARFQGGPNAGHTLEFNGSKHVLHTIPSGIFHENKVNLIGNGVLIDAYIICKEIELLRAKGVEPRNRMKISDKANLILPTHRILDAAQESSKGAKKIGSTVKGIGPAYTDKVGRCGLRMKDIFCSNFKQKYEDLKNQHLGILKFLKFDVDNYRIEDMSLLEYEKAWLEGIEELKSFEVIATEYYLNEAMKQGKKILAEGAQGSLLDIDFGSYPFVTSSNTTAAGVCTGLGISPSSLGRVFGVFKAYCTRVGSGPFPTELEDADGEKLRKDGYEYGSTTGRPRRCGWLDLPALYYTIMLNGVTDLIITKSDVLDKFDQIKICSEYKINGKRMPYFPSTDELEHIELEYHVMDGWKRDITKAKTYEELPEKLKQYLNFIQQKTQTPISIVSLGPDRSETVFPKC
ncbi:MAG: adenylosuccinate synthase [Bacteroidales bacterium]